MISGIFFFFFYLSEIEFYFKTLAIVTSHPHPTRKVSCTRGVTYLSKVWRIRRGFGFWRREREREQQWWVELNGECEKSFESNGTKRETLFDCLNFERHFLEFMVNQKKTVSFLLLERQVQFFFFFFYLVVDKCNLFKEDR